MNLSQFAEKIEDLPTLPVIAKQINSEAQNDTLTAKGLSEIVGKEPALAVKVLKLANSAFYGLSRQVTTIDRAISLLGFNTIKKLALTLSLFKIFKHGNKTELDLE
jgi:HD-like signal output (HDOD) protein